MTHPLRSRHRNHPVRLQIGSPPSDRPVEGGATVDDSLEPRTGAQPGKAIMQVYLDERQCDVSAECVGEAILAGAALAETHGRMIVEVEVDGTRWTERELGAPERANFIAEEVRLTSADPVELVSSTFTDAADALDEADALHREAAELIQLDQQRKAMEKLGQALSIWMAVQQTVEKGATLMQVDLDDVKLSESTAQSAVEQLGIQLNAIKAAVEMEDPVQLSDSLLYELPDVVEQWRSLLRELRFRVRGESN